MEKKIEAETWIYVIIQNPGKDENIFGQHDAENNVSYVPVFLKKDSAQKGMYLLPNDKDKKYEVQAIIYEDLATQARENDFLIFVIDNDGKVTQQIAP